MSSHIRIATARITRPRTTPSRCGDVRRETKAPARAPGRAPIDECRGEEPVDLVGQGLAEQPGPGRDGDDPDGGADDVAHRDAQDVEQDGREEEGAAGADESGEDAHHDADRHSQSPVEGRRSVDVGWGAVAQPEHHRGREHREGREDGLEDDRVEVRRGERTHERGHDHRWAEDRDEPPIDVAAAAVTGRGRDGGRRDLDDRRPDDRPDAERLEADQRRDVEQHRDEHDGSADADEPGQEGRGEADADEEHDERVSPGEDDHRDRAGQPGARDGQPKRRQPDPADRRGHPPVWKRRITRMTWTTNATARTRTVRRGSGRVRAMTQAPGRTRAARTP